MLNEGKVAEQGTHEQLVALHGLYYRMWMAQAEDTPMENSAEEALEAKEPKSTP